MYNPQISYIGTSEEIITGFGGYRRNIKAGENEFYDEINMSSNMFPLMSPRNKRGTFRISGTSLHGLFAKDRMCFINNGKLWYGDTCIQGLTFPDMSVKRQFVSMGTKIIVFPDKVYVDTADISDFGSLDATFTSSGTVTFSLCKADGTLYENYTVSRTTPLNPSNGDLWLDTAAEPNSLNQYSSYSGMWMPVAETYVKISSPLIGSQFSKYDGVTVSGATDNRFNGSFTVWDKTENSIVVTGIISNVITQTSALTVSRTVPDMDFICENGNRLWGCSSRNNVIYASKLGDPKNFNCFMGISTDSYAVTVGTDGDFTGAVSFRGYVLFFKENCVHKIYGSNPPYSVNSVFLRGVQKGSEKSLVILNETLYYKSPTGVCSYEGGVPLLISDELGEEYYKDAVAGALGNKYYICMSNKNNVRYLFTYDELSGLWHKEDQIDIKEFASHNCNLYFISENGTNRFLCIADAENVYGNFASVLGGYSAESSVPWQAETGLWGLSLPGNKYYSKITLMLKGEQGASVQVWFEYDNSGTWERKCSISVENTKSYTLPFITPRCGCLRMRICGTGKVTVLNVSRCVERGSELNV